MRFLLDDQPRGEVGWPGDFENVGLSFGRFTRCQIFKGERIRWERARKDTERETDKICLMEVRRCEPGAPPGPPRPGCGEGGGGKRINSSPRNPVVVGSVSCAGNSSLRRNLSGSSQPISNSNGNQIVSANLTGAALRDERLHRRERRVAAERLARRREHLSRIPRLPMESAPPRHDASCQQHQGPRDAHLGPSR